MRQEFCEAFKLRASLSVLLVLTVFAFIVYIIALIDEIDIFERIDRNEFVTFSELSNSDEFIAVSSLFVILLAAASFVLLVIWTYRTFQNVIVLRAEDTRFSPGWTIGGWLIPVLNLIMPFLIFVEMWKASGTERPYWRQSASDALIVIWWLLAVCGGVGSIIAGFFRSIAIENGSTAADAGLALVAATVVSAAFALTTVAITWRLANRQSRTYDEFVAAGVYHLSPEPVAPQPASDAASRQTRLAELQRLGDAGLITDEELTERRARILDDL